MGKQAKNNSKIARKRRDNILRQLFGSSFKSIVNTKTADSAQALVNEKEQARQTYSKHHTPHNKHQRED